MYGNLAGVLQASAAGSHPACVGCPWNPQSVGPIAFGTSCCVHGVDWTQPTSAVSIQIVRDPGGSTPEKTGRLCFVCNRQTTTDRTAQNASALWDAAVAAGQNPSVSAALLRGHYWTNAVMHGGTGPLADFLESARHHCTGVLRDQLQLLQPKIVIASGKDAADSLFEIGVLKRRWAGFRTSLNKDVYSETASGPIGGATVFVTYHTSAGVVNRTVSGLYSAATETYLKDAILRLQSSQVAEEFLDRNSASNSTGRGLRVLLLHWLQIGEAIRRAHGT